MSITTGDVPPDFTLPNQDGKLVRLADSIGKKIILIAFYPGDFTPVCTKEMVCFKEDYSEFTKLGVEILAISCDSVEEHKKFVAEYHFNFDLLADVDASVAKLYDCKLPLVKKANRGVFIVGLDGKIKYAHRELLPMMKRSNEELLKVIKTL